MSASLEPDLSDRSTLQSEVDSELESPKSEPEILVADFVVHPQIQCQSFLSESEKQEFELSHRQRNF